MAIPYTESNGTFKRYKSISDLLIDDWQNMIDKVLTNEKVEQPVNEESFEIETETPSEEHKRLMDSFNKIYPEMTRLDNEDLMTMITATNIVLDANHNRDRDREEWIEQMRRKAEESTRTRAKMETISQANFIRDDLKNTKRNKLYTTFSLVCAVFSTMFWPTWVMLAASRYMLANSQTVTGNVIFGIAAVISFVIFAFGMNSIQRVAKRSRHYKTCIAKLKAELYKLDDSFLSDKEVEDKYKFRENDDTSGEFDED